MHTHGLVLADGEAKLASEVAKTPAMNACTLRYNPKVEQLYGGERADSRAVHEAIRNHTSGHVEDAGLPSAVFEQQYNAFHATGRVDAPDGRQFANAAAGGAAGACQLARYLWYPTAGSRAFQMQRKSRLQARARVRTAVLRCCRSRRMAWPACARCLCALVKAMTAHSRLSVAHVGAATSSKRTTSQRVAFCGRCIFSAVRPVCAHTNFSRPMLAQRRADTSKPAKRQRTEAERAAKAEKRAAAATAVEEGGTWRLRAAQPWADKTAKAPELNDEQREYLAKITAEKAEKEAANAKETPVRFAARWCHAACAMLQR